MLNKRFLIVISGLFLLTIGQVFAQSSIPLSFGTWTSGTLREGEELWYSVRASGEGIVTVETRGDLDTILEAYDSSRNMIAEDDDSGDSANARLEIFAESGQTYLFKLTGYGDSAGAYRINASFESVQPDTVRNTERSRAVLLSQDEQVAVFFRRPSESRWYRHELTRPQNLLIAQTKGNLDTIISFYDAQGNFLDQDDDSGDNTNARLSKRLPRGAVLIEVKTYGGSPGATTLQVESWYRD